MRSFVLLLSLVLVALVQSSPVATQPFGPLGPRPPTILNGCSENALFAILNSHRGQYCLETLLPRAANVASSYSVFCSGGQWGCCEKSAGMNGCKVRGAIPTRTIPPPPATQ